VECGVFKGTGVLFWAKLLQIFNPLADRRVIGFDTFEGFPEDTTKAFEMARGEALVAESSYAPISPETIGAIAAEGGLARRVELVKGDATHTIPQYVEGNRGFRIALLNLDFDVYAPTKVALEVLFPLVVPGGVVIFDEYALRGWGESDAVDEYLADRGQQLRRVPCVKGHPVLRS
jgi:hypothetical protein